MNLRISLLVATCVLLPLLCGAQQTAVNQDTPAEPKNANPPLKAETASVEEVLATEDDGYHASSYIVRWHGNRVLLVDPSASTQLIAGDNVSFVVSHHDVGGKRLLSFVFTRNPDCRCEDKRQQPTAPPKGRDPGPVAGGADFKTGVVEEVLSAEDDGYRSTGYIVQAQGKRIAIADPIAQTHYGIGDSITFLAVRTKIKGSSLLAFMALPPDINGAKPDPAVTPGMTSEAKLITAPQSGVITEVLTANDADYSYRAYIVEMLGARLVVEDSSGAGAHQVGEQLAFVSRRVANPLTPGHGLLSFGLATQQNVTGNDLESAHVSLRTDTATVDEVLTTDLNGDRYVAYIVKWNGARVAISDVFASTHYAVGDRITFPVTRAGAAGQGHLHFMIFNFTQPSPPTQKGTASNSSEKPT
jgi:hypothetical protein